MALQYPRYLQAYFFKNTPLYESPVEQIKTKRSVLNRSFYGMHVYVYMYVYCNIIRAI